MQIRVIRAIKRMSQYDLQKKANIPQPKISLIERGYIKPTEDEKTAVAMALGVSVHDVEWEKGD